MAKIGVFIPKYCRVGDTDVLKKLKESDIRKESLAIAKCMTDVCGGAISIEVTGYYEFCDGFLSECPTLEIYCFCKKSQINDVAAELKPLVSEIRLRLAQNSIGMYINDEFIEL